MGLVGRWCGAEVHLGKAGREQELRELRRFAAAGLANQHKRATAADFVH